MELDSPNIPEIMANSLANIILLNQTKMIGNLPAIMVITVGSTVSLGLCFTTSGLPRSGRFGTNARLPPANGR